MVTVAAFRKPGPQERTPTIYRVLAVAAGLLLWAFDLLGTFIRNPICYLVVAIVALAMAAALFRAAVRRRGHQATQTTALGGGLYALLGACTLALAVGLWTVVEFRLASLVLSLVMGGLAMGLGIFGQSDAQPPVEDRDDLSAEQERQRIEELSEMTRAQREE